MYMCVCIYVHTYMYAARRRSWFSYLIFAANQIRCENEILNISISIYVYRYICMHISLYFTHSQLHYTHIYIHTHVYVCM